MSQRVKMSNYLITRQSARTEENGWWELLPKREVTDK